MTSAQKLHFVKLVFYLVVVERAACAFNLLRHDASYPSFTCGPDGIKHYINQTVGLKPVVRIRCPRRPVHVDAHMETICEVLSGTFAKITWLHNGKPISYDSIHHVRVDKLSCNQTLKFALATTSDSGEYTCKVTNEAGTVNKTCQLNVKVDKAKIIHIEYLKIAGHRQTAFLQGSVKLKCNMLNVENAIWLKNSKKIPWSDRHIIMRNHTFGKRGMMSTLQIINVTKNDEGLYMCLGYKSGITANKTLYLETEPCPSGHYCPHKENVAIPYPSSVKAGSNDTDVDEMKSCFPKGPQHPVAVSSVSISHNSDVMLILMSTLMALGGYLQCTICHKNK